jgi:acyl-CoA thioester hydrolase
MPEPVARTFHVGWGDLDSNGHMKNTAYLDKAVDVRMMYFQEPSFAVREFEQLRLGPVVRRDEIEYYRELRLLEPMRVIMTLAGASEDGTRSRIRSEFFQEDGKLVARVTSTGGWLDLSARKLTMPPEGLAEALRGYCGAKTSSHCLQA